MKLNHLLSAAVLAGLMSLPLTAGAQDRHRGDDNRTSQSGRNDRDRRDDRDRHDDRNRRDDRNRNDDRWDRDRRDNDRWDRDRRDNNRWDRNNGHDNGRHNGWDRRDDRRTTVIVSYNDRHDDWHRSHHTSHQDSCGYDGGNWRYNDTRYRDRYNNDRRYDNVYRYDGRDYGYRGDEYYRREQTSREWKNLATLGGLISVFGLLNHDDTLVFAGAAGALYSEYRYNQDKRSQDRLCRARAYYFDQPDFYRDGHRYERRNVTRNGERYFQFVRCD